jgi:hypothetical protein
MRSYRGRSGVGWSAGEFLLIGLLRTSPLRRSEKFVSLVFLGNSLAKFQGPSILEDAPRGAVLLH